MEESNTRQSSKLSLGSSPSILSGDENLGLGEPLSPFNEAELAALNAIIRANSPYYLSNEEGSSERDYDNSSLSSAPDDFPLSRSPSPEEHRTLRKRRKGNSEKTTINDTAENNNETNPKKQRMGEVSITPERNQSENEDPKQNQVEEEIKEIKEEEKKKQEEKEVEIEIAQKEEEKIICEITENDEDYQQRHKKALDALTQIELEFARLRDKMYQEKLSELNNEAMMIENGTHPELLSLMIEIQEKKEKRVTSAEAWRKYQYAEFKKQYEGFEYQANIHFISQKNSLRRNLLSSINRKKWSMEGERKKASDFSTVGQLFSDGQALILHKKEMKEEADDLNEIKESIGFPMAPNPKGLDSRDVDEDLRLLGIIGDF
ncbi:hypothetical protein G6F56_006171 [Rhizopus delemar]|uniref:Uncharacterized protein n=1 Tax=Rhizopus stolonifer TaxID=4846 RepID=A0A367KJW4_RHIST|nr:hypothetical protein G6F56_006171 [Rhizopus delemar]RCI02449.1 hypothetical protein CU098_009787 [Rhizopus stolonifer]